MRDCKTCMHYKFRIINNEFITGRESHYCKMYGVVLDINKDQGCYDYEEGTPDIEEV